MPPLQKSKNKDFKTLTNSELREFPLSSSRPCLPSARANVLTVVIIYIFLHLNTWLLFLPFNSPASECVMKLLSHELLRPLTCSQFSIIIEHGPLHWLTHKLTKLLGLAFLSPRRQGFTDLATYCIKKKTCQSYNNIHYVRSNVKLLALGRHFFLITHSVTAAHRVSYYPVQSWHQCGKGANSDTRLPAWLPDLTLTNFQT